MHIDVQTLMVASSLVGLLIAITLAGIATVIREEPALIWWTAAAFGSAIGLGLISVEPILPEPTGMLAGLALLALTPGLFWAGARRFEHRTVPLPLVLARPILWLTASALSGGPGRASTIAGFAPWVAYLLAAAFELWRGRSEKLRARWFLVALFVIHACVFTGGITDALFHGFVEGSAPRLKSWFGVITVEGMGFFVGTAISIVGLAQQRRENFAVERASLDSLTGIASRGSFLDLSERLLTRCRSEGAPLSLALFDLDHFKQVNDSHGHIVGDAVIRTFAETTRQLLRANDVVGRYGGEEFAVVLPRTTIEAAYVIADRIRHAFAENGRVVSETEVHATVSGGVAAATAGITVSQLVDTADRALYRAKNMGRNRVQRSDETPPGDNVIRVA